MTSEFEAHGRAIAVLPFRHHGPDSERHISEVLGDELIDLLASTKGLRVLASGATARYAASGDRDPRIVGRELGVELVVDGSVSVGARPNPRIRVSARLLEVGNGSQIWSERIEGSLADVFEMQDMLGKRIAEALRLQLEHIGHVGTVSEEVIESYLRARALARSIGPWTGPDGAVAEFERCLALAPGFRPALAGYALACLRGWFMPRGDTRDWAELTRTAVEAARANAGDLAETQLAIAMLAVQHGEFHEAAVALYQALRLAPTYANAHDYLGRLQLEAGRAEQGVRHAELALELDPSLNWCLRDLARHHALHGDRDRFEHRLAQFKLVNPMGAGVLETRTAIWFGDLDRARRAHESLEAPVRAQMGPFAELLLRPNLPPEFEAERWILPMAQMQSTPRGFTLSRQMGAEVMARHGQDELAMRLIHEAAQSVLVDLDWLDHCPLFTRLRERSDFMQIRDRVSDRAQAIWSI
jgi:TolB-like protein